MRDKIEIINERLKNKPTLNTVVLVLIVLTSAFFVYLLGHIIGTAVGTVFFS
jgi:hypothetical protein